MLCWYFVSLLLFASAERLACSFWTLYYDKILLFIIDILVSLLGLDCFCLGWLLALSNVDVNKPGSVGSLVDIWLLEHIIILCLSLMVLSFLGYFVSKELSRSLTCTLQFPVWRSSFYTFSLFTEFMLLTVWYFKTFDKHGRWSDYHYGV